MTTKEEILTDYCKEHNIPRPDYSIVKMIMNVAESYAAEAVAEHDKEMYLNMQYYMEYCRTNGYVTPQEWIEKHKHF